MIMKVQFVKPLHGVEISYGGLRLSYLFSTNDIFINNWLLYLKEELKSHQKKKKKKEELWGRVQNLRETERSIIRVQRDPVCVRLFKREKAWKKKKEGVREGNNCFSHVWSNYVGPTIFNIFTIMPLNIVT